MSVIRTQSDASLYGREPLSLVSLLRVRAAERPDALAYTFLLDGEEEELSLTYGELDRRARTLAVLLSMRAREGSRALVLMPPGLDYIVAFFASLYAGLMAVPAPPPQKKRGLPRLLSIVRDCHPSVIITTAEFGAAVLADPAEDGLREIASLPWVAVEAALEEGASEWRSPEVSGDSLAFLQYTSGSTGHPKGVALSHRNLLENQRMIRDAFGHDERSSVVGWLPPYHDMGLIGNILQPLYVGVPCIQMTPQHFLIRPRRWLAAITKYRATTSGGPNFAFDLCVAKIPPEQRQGLDLSSWRVAFNGAEPVRASTLERFSKAFAEAGFRARAFYPCYGLAEATLLVTGGDPAADPVIQHFSRGALAERRAVETAEQANGVALIGCGRAPRGLRIAVVDPESNRLCVDGQVGEIWASGASIARGYWERPEESARTFEARLDSGEGPFLRTGDLGFLRGTELFPAGRLKDLIILRGQNLYPQDLEQTAEDSHASLRAGGSAAFSVEAEDEERLILVLEAEPRAVGSFEDVAGGVRRAIAERHEVTVQALVFIKPGSLLRTTSGKVQRAAMRAKYLAGELEALWTSSWQVPSREPSDSSPVSEVEPSGSALERELASIWREVLRVAQVRRDDDFLRLGGDSLGAVQVMARVQALFGIELPPSVLFDAPILSEFAEELERQRELSKKTDVAVAPLHALGAEARRSPEASFPLSFVQERLWLLEQLTASLPVYHIAARVSFEGELHLDVLSRAVNRLTARHEALRTIFELTPEGPRARTLGAELVTLSPREVPDGQGEAFLREEAARSFELERRPPVRWTLARLSSSRHVLSLSCHHLIADGWSLGVLLRELVELYRAELGLGEALLGGTPRSYGDYAKEQRADAERRFAPHLDYWRRRWAEPPASLELWTDRPRGATPTYRGARHEVVLDAAKTSRLSELGRKAGVTPFVALTAIFSVLLARSAGQREISIGTPVLGRRRLDEENALGCFIDTLPLRVDLRRAPSVASLLLQVREEVLAAQAHALPFERILRELSVERSPSRAPLVQCMISMQPELPELPTIPGLQVEASQLYLDTAQFDLALDIAPSQGQLRCTWEYASDLFDAETIARYSSRFVELIERFVEAPERRVDEFTLGEGEERGPEALFAGGSSSEKAQLQVGVEVSLSAGDIAAVHERFEGFARLRPSALAITDGERSLSYDQLNRRSNQWGRALRRRGVGPETRVALAVDRSIDLVVAALAVHKAGGAYVPLDVAQPAARSRRLLEEAAVSLALTRSREWEGLGSPALDKLQLDADAMLADCEDDSDLEPRGDADRLAYVLFTSGSTGRPKGVQVTQRTLARTLDAWEQVYRLSPERLRLLQLAGPAFDVWTADWVRALGLGGTLVIAPTEAALDPRSLDSWVTQHEITFVDLVPAQARAWMAIEGARGLGGLELLIVGSDVWTWDEYITLKRRLPEVRLLSCYGVTEATVDSAYFEGEAVLGPPTRAVPLGCAFPGTRLVVLDVAGRAQAPGLPGELVIRGAGVSRGYDRDARLTALKFAPDPFASEPGSRLYRTGDRARFLPDGTLEFLGRLDHQTKVRGVRVEPREIEARLLEHPAVKEAIVAPRELRGQPELVAYLIPEDLALRPTAEILGWARSELPRAFVPGVLVWLDTWPLSANGKIDRRALPLPANSESAQAHRAPATDLEELLASIWREVLGGARAFGRDDNFFDVGGHSLLLARVQAELTRRSGLEVPLLELFQHPTIATLAASLERSSGAVLEASEDSVEAVDAADEEQQREIAARRRAQQRARRREQEGGE